MKENLAWQRNLTPNTQSYQGQTITDPKGMARAINVAQISRNLKLYREIPGSFRDPLENYKKLVKDKNLDFSIRIISMCEMKKLIKYMKSTPSTGIH